jgi:arylformamidase
MTRVVDLTVPISTDMPVYPGDPEVSVEQSLWLARGDGANMRTVHIGTHSGTHVDAPNHVHDDWPRLDDVPLERFAGRPLVVDLRGIGADEPITAKRLGAALAGADPGDILLLHTGWTRFWGSDRYQAHPWLEPGAARAVSEAGLRTVGIDALSVDRTPENAAESRLETHEALLGAGGVIIENLTHLDALAGLANPLFVCLPLNLNGVDGSPARAVALDLEA